MAISNQVAPFRAANTALTGKVEADLAKFWSRMNLSRVDNATNALLDVVPLLTQKYGEVAATIAADWYELLRADAKVKGAKYRALTADPVAVEVSRKSVQSAAVFLWTPDPEQTLRALQGTVGRHVLQAGRDTLTVNAVRDPSAEGWVRVGNGECDWCANLLDGEIHYVEGYGFDAHNNCRCTAEPVFG